MVSRIEELESDYARRKQRLESSTAKSDEIQRAKQQDLQKKNEADQVEFQQEAKERYAKEVKQLKETLAAEKRELHEKTEQALDEYPARIQDERNRQQAIVQDYENRMKRQGKSHDNETEARLARLAAGSEQEAFLNAQNEKYSRDREGHLYRSSIKEYQKNEEQHAKAANLARQAAIEENEKDWRFQIQNQSDTHDKELLSVKAKAKQTEDYLYRQYQSQLKDVQSQNARTSQTTQQTHQDDFHQMTQEFKKATNQNKSNFDKEQVRLQGQMESQYLQMSDAKDRALTEQGTQYAATMKRKQNDALSENEMLKKSLHEMRTSPDSGKISLAAEESLRKQWNDQEAVVRDADRQRNQRNQARHKDRLQQSEKDFQDQLRTLQTNTAREKTETRDMLERQWSHSLQDVEAQRQAEAKKNAADKSRLSADFERTRSMNQAEIVRQMSESALARESDLNSKLLNTLEDSKFNEMQLRREHQAKLQETIRGYERLLREQKNEIEQKYMEQRNQTVALSKENERRMKQALDEQARSYEHRIADLTSGQKHREASLQEAHAEELEKVKKSYALQLARKSPES